MKLQGRLQGWAIVFTAGAMLCGVAQASEREIKNDSFGGGLAYRIGDFVPGEQAGVRLTSPCDGTIVAVQVGWLEGTPGHPPSLERAIHIYAGDTFPTPGAQLAYLEAPVLTPGYVNEFRYLDEASSIPLAVPVTNGQRFYVTLEFEEATDIEAGDPTVVSDTDGCQSGKNVLYVSPGMWINFCSLPVHGDLVIRAVIDCGEASGACCLPSGQCQYITEAACGSASGTYHGDLVTCGAVQCPQPTAACCFEATSGCLDLTAVQCQTAAGVWAGVGTSCATFDCFPSGACCLLDGTCVDGVSQVECTAQGGAFQGVDTHCSSVDCPEPAGACCIASTGGCLEQTEANCGVIGGYWAGAGTTCADLNQDGEADACHPGDVNCDGAVNVFDIDPFVVALTSPSTYRTTYPDCYISSADANRDGAVNTFDIDPFVLLLVGK